MPKLPVISGDECIRALERLGYCVARTKGDHVRLRCPEYLSSGDRIRAGAGEVFRLSGLY